MRSLRLMPLYFALLFLIGQPISAREIDLAALLGEQASSSSAGELVNARNSQCLITSRIFKNVSQNCAALSVANIRAQDAGVRYSEIKASPIPETVTTESFLFRNCSSVEKKEPTKNVSMHYREGLSIVTMDSIQTQSSGSATLTVSGQQLGISQSHQISFSETKTHDFGKDITETITLDETVKPYTALVVNIEKRIHNAYIDFDGDIIPNADLYMVPCCGWTGTSTLLGQFIDVVGERKLTVRGQIWNAKAQSTSKSNDEVPLDRNNPAHCPPTVVPPIIKPVSTTATAALRQLNNEMQDIVQFVPLSSSAVTAQNNSGLSPSKKVVPFVSGMTITTANTVSNVEVRAKSLAAGFCGVHFETSGGSAQFLAPPQSWSPWTNLVSHVGTVQLTITNQVVCDVGVLAEVRYSK